MERAEGDCLLASLTLVERSEFKREREREIARLGINEARET
jgi:hypothetical protein